MPRRTNKAIKEYKLKSGATRYCFKTYIGMSDAGKPVRVTRQGFKTYSEADEAFNKLRAKGTTDYVTDKQITVNELWNLWFDLHKKQVKESSANKTYEVYKNHVAPTFGNTHMDKIKAAALQKWINDKSKEIVKYREAYNIFDNLFKYALVLGYVKSNPLTRIIIPKKTSRKRRDTKSNYYDSPRQVNEFLAAAKKQNFRKYTFFKLLVLTGMRKSEALALKWADIDFGQKVIHVNKTLAIGFENKLIVQKPKTKSSLRDVPLADSLAKTLKEYRKQRKIIYPLLFCKFDGTCLNLSAPGNWLTYVYKENPQLKRITVHGFRHTFATLMLQPNTGNTPKDVQTILGHENIDMTLNIYTHESKKGQQNLQGSVNSLKI